MGIPETFRQQIADIDDAGRIAVIRSWVRDRKSGALSALVLMAERDQSPSVLKTVAAAIVVIGQDQRDSALRALKTIETRAAANRWGDLPDFTRHCIREFDLVGAD